MKLHYRFTLLLVLCGFGTFRTRRPFRLRTRHSGASGHEPGAWLFVGSLQGNPTKPWPWRMPVVALIPWVPFRVQLAPSEAMVKREAGFSPATSDWEFFRVGCFCR